MEGRVQQGNPGGGERGYRERGDHPGSSSTQPVGSSLSCGSKVERTTVLE